MATAAFKSTTKRSSVAESNSNSNSSSSSHHHNHRRSRSVSRFSHRLPSVEPPSASRRGKFVNTVRGSGVPEISLDDLAIEMFSCTDIGERRGRTTSSSSEVSNANNTASSSPRGRSVSRRGSRVGDLRSSSKIYGDKFGVSDATSRRRRSLSVVPNHQVSDSENEHIQKNRSHINSRDINVWTKQKPQIQAASSNRQKGLRRCSSQKDLVRSYDGYSSYSSALTDEEGNDACHNSNRTLKGKQASSGQNKVKVENQHTELVCNDSLQSADSGTLKTVSTIRRNYKTKLEESEKRKQELLAEIMLEEERGKELQKIVGDLLPNTKSTPVKRPRGRKRSTDRSNKRLVEEADKIIEEFISSVEETDISSFDGERSDTSSVIGGLVKPALQCGDLSLFDGERSDTSSIRGGLIKPTLQYEDIESFKSPVRSTLLPGEMDGVVLPWLKWETGDDGNLLLADDNKQNPTTPKTVLQDTEEVSNGLEQEQSFISKSSHGSWSPGFANSFSLDVGQTNTFGEVESCKTQLLSQVPRRSQVDVGGYIKLPSNEVFLSEKWKQRERIHSGGLLICNSGSFGGYFL